MFINIMFMNQFFKILFSALGVFEEDKEFQMNIFSGISDVQKDFGMCALIGIVGV